MIRGALQRRFNYNRPYSSGASEEQFKKNPYLIFLNENKGAITVLVGLAGGIITGVNWLIGMKVDKFEIKYDLKFDSLEKKVDLKIDTLNLKIDSLEKKVDQKIDSLEKKVDTLEVDMKSNHKELIQMLQPFIRKVEVHEALWEREKSP
ncbi:hypothetical protein MIR68_003972 [Amoeboaphelidium protococcarum]|nr:hypothetical protein MIR68_003972 [Amoeboaphelidium protococcarum]